MLKENLYSTPFSRIYPSYIAKVERKGRTKTELDEIILWLTGYTQKQFESHLKKETDLKNFYTKSAKLNPKRKLITGVVCGIRVEDIKDPLMQEIRIWINSLMN